MTTTDVFCIRCMSWGNLIISAVLAVAVVAVWLDFAPAPAPALSTWCAGALSVIANLVGNYGLKVTS